jgi:hypothetical protein
MTTTKLITGLVLATGVTLATIYLISGEESETRKKFKKSGDDLLDFLCDVYEKGKEAVKGRAGEAMDSVKEKVADTAGKYSR